VAAASALDAAGSAYKAAEEYNLAITAYLRVSAFYLPPSFFSSLLMNSFRLPHLMKHVIPMPPRHSLSNKQLTSPR
jgi:hypothetical protein